MGVRVLGGPAARGAGRRPSGRGRRKEGGARASDQAGKGRNWEGEQGVGQSQAWRTHTENKRNTSSIIPACTGAMCHVDQSRNASATAHAEIFQALTSCADNFESWPEAFFGWAACKTIGARSLWWCQNRLKPLKMMPQTIFDETLISQVITRAQFCFSMGGWVDPVGRGPNSQESMGPSCQEGTASHIARS